MNLTTVDRVKKLMVIDGDKEDVVLKQLVSSTSKAIENSARFNRYIEKVERTEYFDVEYAQKVIQVKGMPIDTDETFKIWHDTSREFADNTLIASSNYYVDAKSGMIKFDRYTLSGGVGALKIQYTGGLSASVDILSAIISTLSGSFTVSEVIEGQTSGALGILRAIYESALSINIEVTSGEFQVGETIKGKGSADAVPSCILGAISQNPIVMAYSDLAYACDVQVGFIHGQKDHLGQKSISIEGGSASFEPLNFLPEVKRILMSYRRFGNVG